MSDPAAHETYTPVTAPASSRPCQLYRHLVTPRPSRTQGHHRHPVYLQNRVYGRIRDPELLWVCGLCHDSIHDWLSFRLGEAREPKPYPSRRARLEADRAFAWYQEARLELPPEEVSE